MFRILNAIMAALFVFAAAVQYNDPDPVRWMAMYLAAGGVALLAAVRESVSPASSLSVGLVALVWAAVLATGGPGLDVYSHMFDAWEMRSLQAEEAREASGLFIVALWMAVVAARPWIRARKARHT